MHNKMNKAKTIWEKYKYVILILLVGIVLLLLPSGKKSTSSLANTATPVTVETTAAQEAQEAETRLAALLSQIDGAGQVKVLLSYQCSAETEYASDDGETVIISAGSGTQTAVERKTIYPQYLGAVVVCEGANAPQVRLDVLQAVAQFTGLSTDKISVLKLRSDME